MPSIYRYATVMGVLLAIALAACTPRDTLSDIERAERLLQDSPTEALNIITAVDHHKIHGKHNRAHYALVHCEAHYNNYIDITSDTLSRPMMEYYIASESHEERARALYQYALIAHNRGEDAEAMIMLLEVQKSLQKAPNTKLEGLTHRTMADIYGEGCLFANALDSYAKAKACFDTLGLEYHSASAQYDMGGTLIQLRNFEEAKSALQRALDYGVEAQHREFICAVLHEMLDLAIYCEEYERLDTIIDLFSQHEALLYGEAHYNAAVAMSLSHKGRMSEALALLDSAMTMEDAQWADLEYARYIIYRNGGDDHNALIWQEQSKNAQDALMIEVLEQPVLNIQIDMLRERLEAEQRERDLVRQRNILLCLALVVILSIVALYIVRYVRRKRDELSRYIEMVGELQDALRALPRETAESVNALYRDRFTELNELCDIYYEHGGSTRNKSIIFNKLTATIEAIKSDEHRLRELEEAVNKYRNNIMSRLREVPKLNERDMRVALYIFAGFSNRAIAIFIDSDPVAVSRLRYSIKQKVKSAEMEDGEMLINALSEK